MKKVFTLKCVLLLSVLFLSTKSNAQIIGWQFGNPASTGSEVSYDATTINSNLNTSVLSRGAGITASALARGFSSSNFSVSGTKANAVSTNQFYTFSITPKTNFKVSLSTLNATLRRSSTGSNAYIWMYSINGTTFNEIGSDVSFTSTSDGVAQPQIDLSGITALQNVTANTIIFRLYAWGASASGGSFAVGRYAASNTTNSLAVGGTVISSISTNADLSDLSLSTGTLSPVFSSTITSYTSTVANSVSNITVTPTSADANSIIKVNGTTVVSGSASGNIPLIVGSNTITTIVTAEDGTTTKTYTTTVTRATAGTPLLTTTSVITDFGEVCTGLVVGPNSFTIDGSDLDGTDIVISAFSGYSFSLTAAGTYTTTLNIPYTAPGFTGKVVYVKFNPTAVQSYNGNIVLNGGGVSNYNVPVTGSGVNTKPTVTTGSASSVTATTATVTANISTIGCTSVSSYGFEYSTVSGFGDGTGTPVSASNLAAGNFSATITGLSPNTRYYYKALATNAGGTTYGLQQSFTNTPLPVLISAQPGLSYTEDFSDVGNWGPFFTSGNGANHFGGLSATTATGIPDPTKITASSTNFNGSGFTSSGGIHRFIDGPTTPTQSIIFLSTGSPDNTTSTALDFYMDFTGLNAGTFSFDYATLNNSTGNRNGSFRVYATTDGIIFTELTFASVLDFTNNVPISGSKSNIQLPAIFNNSATARLRFYYHNGSGNTGSGSRPKFNIDNLTVTGLATTPCATPTAPATSLVFGAITDTTIAASFTAASPATDSYLIVMSTNTSLISNPIDGQNYSIGDNVGDGTVIAKGAATSFTATGLNALTTYYFFVFPMNAICTGGPLYYTTSVLNGSATTIAGLPPCAAPTTQPSNLTFGSTTTSSIAGSFTATAADQYLVVRSLSASLGADPLNGAKYATGEALGNGTVVQRSSATTFSANGLAPDTKYNFFIFSLNNQACINGPAYNIANPLAGAQSTIPLPLCVTPTSQPTNLNLSASNNLISGTFTAADGADAYVVVKSITAILGATPTDGTNYTAGDAFGSGTVVSNTGNTSFVATNLAAGNTYFFFVFAANKTCSGGTKYATQSPLSASKMTTNVPAYNYYFGNLHSHSDYSDGNKDNPTLTPADDYAFAKTAQCMDYLGISEHNHYSSPHSPGNQIATYHLGTDQANTFTNNNPDFLAMYGMEWGVISNGGHVVIYGNGLDQLFGWESGSGAWGATNNYDVYVAKSDYTGTNGLFKTVNDYIATTNSFATLAHPNLTDYNNIAGTAYDAVADNAIVGSAIESGPAFSTNTTYSDPSNFNNENYLFYFNTMLAKGYHLGPVIDHDNHNTTFGKTTYSRTAIVSRSLSKDSIIKSMRDMHFYATQDCDSKLDFTINTQIMGSQLTDRFGPNISVQLTDGTTSTSAAVIRLMFGVPGSGTLAVKIDSTIGNTYSYNDASLADQTTGYYYIDVINGSSRIISSPIWYTRNDGYGVLPVKLSAFTVQKSGKSAQLDWTTEQEINSSHFIVQRSTDGRRWDDITRVNAAGNSNTQKKYRTFDNTPVNGINYYRLKQFDTDGRFELSDVRNVVFKSVYDVSISPNPAKDFINVYLTKTDNGLLYLQLTDVAGKVVRTLKTTDKIIKIPTAGIAKGLYFISITNNSSSITQKVIID